MEKAQMSLIFEVLTGPLQPHLLLVASFHKTVLCKKKQPAIANSLSITFQLIKILTILIPPYLTDRHDLQTAMRP